jgi:hypothetical protein
MHGIRRSSRRRIDVSTPDRGRKGHPGIDLHRVRRLHPGDVSIVEGSPSPRSRGRSSTSATSAGPTRSGGRSTRPTSCASSTCARSRPPWGAWTGRRTLRPLQAVIADGHDASDGGELARRFLALCRRAGLPEPVVGTEIEVNGRCWEVDFAWPAHRLCVETDGWAVHGTRRAFERDPIRDADFLLEGWRVVRFTWRRIRDEPDEVIETVRRLLGAPLLLPTAAGGPFAA